MPKSVNQSSTKLRRLWHWVISLALVCFGGVLIWALVLGQLSNYKEETAATLVVDGALVEWLTKLPNRVQSAKYWNLSGVVGGRKAQNVLGLYHVQKEKDQADLLARYGEFVKLDGVDQPWVKLTGDSDEILRPTKLKRTAIFKNGSLPLTVFVHAQHDRNLRNVRDVTFRGWHSGIGEPELEFETN